MIKHIPDDFIMIPNFSFSNPYHVLLSDCIAHDYFFRWCSVQSDGSFSEGYSEGSLTGYLYCHYVLSDFILFSEFIGLIDKLRYLRSLYQKNEQITSSFSVLNHGYWNVGYFHDRVCSCCCHPSNDLSEHPFDFCPWCGAKMDK